jgi:hypothetical protein
VRDLAVAPWRALVVDFTSSAVSIFITARRLSSSVRGTPCACRPHQFQN